MDSVACITTHLGLPNSVIVEKYLSFRKMEVLYDQVSVLPTPEHPEGLVRASEDIRKKCPFGAIPALQLKDGTVVTETSAIVAFFESAHPQGALDGGSSVEQALKKMWHDRIDLSLFQPMLDAFRCSNGVDMFKNRFPCHAAAFETFKGRVFYALGKLEGLLAERKTKFTAAETICTADIRLYAGLEFGLNKAFGPVLTEEEFSAFPNMKALYDLIAAELR
uniref:GST C-terminal domain-containing protein n=1 Tax=Chromera velia CCMP2878 TaxID=1169474 RepID=A0A0G4H8R2_9ALVE|mmetsp:Transcript_49664/g.97871  ORF Transcript_49664/g.97871 Transcript_49664/m.97871 type:complete len:221 (+) Transcript_49664:211-873(+)|eukprot:Cvel_25192.t1-p1 / transcript=Cvel_25192.t1 / gene=Cvel_25192 / organism=Chromera_velia_CCMP2878 / gene_product=hypothetical protein / transcript_product=hypothetical protein / location=Cvel_scaffold2820:4012-6516(-) / protein_length=220 / sequence_SO=supercontig / SO=protein_coding / is_pseudo=false